jgi:glycosyltransferase involved in cell wall biosynthesis
MSATVPTTSRAGVFDHDPSLPEQSVILVGTYPPRRCGLATFTANTRRGLITASSWHVDVLRLGSDEGPQGQPPEVVACWDGAMTPEQAAECCNEYSCVLLEHEYGILPGREGEDVLAFVEQLHVPLVTVLHTVLVDPSQHQRAILEAVARASHRVVALSPSAADRLVDRYDIDPAIVTVIPHGAEPNLGPAGTERPVIPTLLTWGLLGPGKGIEHAIKAVAILAGRGRVVRYVVAGQTHPNVLAHEGEHYRRALEQLAGELGVRGLVEFDNRYRDWHEVFALVRGADLVVLPYDSREQVTSGVLVDALASGKPIVATAFPHALDVVDGRCGIVVPHEEPEAMADAVERLLTDRRLAASCVAAARAEAARLTWPVVGAQYDELLRAVVDEPAAARS